ncbi:unnamed protein product [Chrysoparadoxa australica]
MWLARIFAVALLWRGAKACADVQIDSIEDLEAFQATLAGPACAPGTEAIATVGAGTIALTTPIAVPAGVTLTLTGQGAAESILDGGGTVQLIALDAGGATLNVSDLTLSHGVIATGIAPPRIGGGAISAPGAGSTISASQVWFVENISNGFGQAGALQADDADVTLTDCIFRGNSATGVGQTCRGGAAMFVGGTATITNTQFIDNVSEGAGGAVHLLKASTMMVTDSIFSGNEAVLLTGGAVVVESDADGAPTADFVGTQFLSNIAGSSGGGLHLFDGCQASLTDVSMSDNMSGAFGGGAQLLGEATITGSTFEGNTAQFSGGALHGGASGGTVSMLTISDTQMTGNIATALDGGAVFLEGEATMSRCTLVENKAKGFGGAIAGKLALVLGLVDSIVTDNESEDSGGGIAIIGTADVDIPMITMTNTVVDMNSAKFDGGGVFLKDSTIFEVAGGSVSDNRGLRGGGIAVVESTLRGIGLLVANNRVSSAGGAGLFSLFSTVDGIESWEFVNNDAAGAGAAVALTGTTGSALSIVFDGAETRGMHAISTDFQTQFACEGCFFNEWDFDFIVLNEGTLTLDMADFRSSTSPQLLRASGSTSTALVRNALVGAGTYAANAWDAGQELGENTAGCDASPSPCSLPEQCTPADLGIVCICFTSLDGTESCIGGDQDINEVAAVSSVLGLAEGALEGNALSNPAGFFAVDAGFDPGRKLMPGGGQSLWKLEVAETFPVPDSAWKIVPDSGLLSLGDRVLVEVEGLYLSNPEAVGPLTGESSVTLKLTLKDEDNVVEASVTEIPVKFNTCVVGQFWDEAEAECRSCFDIDIGGSLNCQAANVTTRNLPLNPGFWRESTASTVIRECFATDSCIGGSSVADVNEYCSTAYAGPYCSVCEPGYAKGIAGRCLACDGGFSDALIAALCLVCAVLLGMFYVFMTEILFEAPEDESLAVGSAASEAFKNIPFHKMRISIVTTQILTQFTFITGIDFPDILSKFFAFLSVFSFDFNWVLKAGCINGLTFYDNLLLSTLGPLALAIALSLTFAIGCWKAKATYKDHERWLQAKVKQVKYRHITLLLVLCFLVFPTTSSVIFSTFSCDTLESGVSYLRADYSLICNTPQHNSYKVYAYFMIVVFPIGIPALFWYVLWTKRQAIQANIHTRTLMTHVPSNPEDKAISIIRAKSPKSARSSRVGSRAGSRSGSRRFSMASQQGSESSIASARSAIGNALVSPGIFFLRKSGSEAMSEQDDVDRDERRASDGTQDEEKAARGDEEEGDAGPRAQVPPAAEGFSPGRRSPRSEQTPGGNSGKQAKSQDMMAALGHIYDESDSEAENYGLGASERKGSQAPLVTDAWNSEGPRTTRSISKGMAARRASQSLLGTHKSWGSLNLNHSAIDGFTSKLTDEENEKLLKFGKKAKMSEFLWRDYKAHRHYFELYELFRRIMLTGILVFIYPGSTSQLAVSVLLSIGFLSAFTALSPFRGVWESRTYLLSCVVVLLTTYLALTVAVADEIDQNGEYEGNTAMAVAIILIVVFVAVSSLFQVISACYQSYAAALEIKESAWTATQEKAKESAAALKQSASKAAAAVQGAGSSLAKKGRKVSKRQSAASGQGPAETKEMEETSGTQHAEDEGAMTLVIASAELTDESEAAVAAAFAAEAAQGIRNPTPADELLRTQDDSRT